ncbi:MAG: ATP-binding protein [Janthinobacterium lividum]
MDARDYAEPALFGLEEPICPYTGLRTFTEEEAIYFRGREEHVAKCLGLLAAERFVMITGASGDGKSSLVFAGLLPEVRAGFLRGRYSSWAVVTFRPERSPLRNMARALAPALRLENSVGAIETELEQGFSSLVQLYQASALCPPAELPAGLTVAEQRQYQRQAANLLVVVDQFEEFFTNPENYVGDGPSTAAQTVVNLLLETTRLAQAQNLPIYIVCTMRSDFVGQCAEFRGLIEQIGTSQYFVPRLLRHEFVEVIKEPALLSGNRISERLVQRLLYDIHHGQDQLPVLQHALRRIWLAADEGREEMDLLHYAMVGGLADELPAADQARFAQWQAGLSAAQQQFLLAQPSLRNVLDAHANQLYYEATSLYNSAFQPPLPPGTAESVIERTFRVLTRTDGQRVVRNRLTGAEITAIIGDAALPWPVVCRILRPFRQAGTTFLSPFLLEEGNDREVLPPDAVLDITHESLIRNWKHLAEWASSEAEDVRIAQDLMQQASRWEANAEDRGFLLPIGSYSYFSQWNKRKQVNASWLAHYVAADGEPEALPQAQAATQHGVLRRFLETSRSRLFMPLLVARYGLGRLAAAVLLPVLLVGVGWWAWQQRTQQADYVAYSIIEKQTSILNSFFVPLDAKANFLLNTDRLKDFIYSPLLGGHDAEEYTFSHQLNALHNDSLALGIELSMFSSVDNLDYDSVKRTNPYLLPLLADLAHRLDRAESISQIRQGQPSLSANQRELSVCTARLIMALTYYLANEGQHKVGQPLALAERLVVAQRLRTVKKQLLARLYKYVQCEVQTTTGPASSPVEFGFCLRVLLGQGDYSTAELAFLDGINPFGPAAGTQQFRRLFRPELSIYANEGSITHSGGYLTSAIIFAAQRQPAQVARCLDLLRTQVTTSNEADAGVAILPYLIKYELFTPTNALDLLRRCSRAGGTNVFSFNELYAATVYFLLSKNPSFEVYDDTQTYSDNSTAADAVRPGSVNAGYLNADRVSFSVPIASRDKTWQALFAATPTIAAQEPLFKRTEQVKSGRENNFNHYQRNQLFLRAFLAKMHGTYVAEFKQQPAAAEQDFVQFSTCLQALKQVLKSGEQINSFQWNLGTPKALGITEANSVGQDPIAYLQDPVRPKTQLFETYYTCSFDAFFVYQLRQATAQKVPDSKLVYRLDSVAFVEAAFPDRYSATRTYSLSTHAFSRSPQFLPNLAWIKAIASYSLPVDSARQRRNRLLLSVAATMQDSAKLSRISLTPSLLHFIRHLGQQPSFSQLPFQVSFSDLAAGLARIGRVRDAFAIAEALDRTTATITNIRIGEQLMLTNNQGHQARLDSFLVRYQKQNPSRQLAGAANSSVAVLCWRAYTDNYRAADFYNFALLLVSEGNSFVQSNGALAVCKGQTMANKSYQAVQGLPAAYYSSRLRQPYYNTILAGIAHLNKPAASDGWYEYDMMQLVYSPVDYDGPND